MFYYVYNILERVSQILQDVPSVVVNLQECSSAYNKANITSFDMHYPEGLTDQFICAKSTSRDAICKVRNSQDFLLGLLTI